TRRSSWPPTTCSRSSTRRPASAPTEAARRVSSPPVTRSEVPMTDTLIPAKAESAAEVGRLRLRTQPFIGGEFRDAISGRRYMTENPATGRPIAEVAEGGPADVDAAVAAARAAFDDGRWSRLNPGDRKRILIRRAGLIDANVRERGLIETIDAGKPITDTVGLDVPETASCIRWHAEGADKVYGQVAPSPEGTG